MINVTRKLRCSLPVTLEANPKVEVTLKTHCPTVKSSSKHEHNYNNKYPIAFSYFREDFIYADFAGRGHLFSDIKV